MYQPTPRRCIERWYVYGLEDPNDGAVRYIGSTPYPERRLADHVERGGKGNGERVRTWVKRLCHEGRPPVMVILDVIEGGRLEAIKSEWKIIREYGRSRLLNGYVQSGYPRPDLRAKAPEGFVTVGDAAKTLGVSRQRIHQLLGTRKVPVTGGRCKLIDSEGMAIISERRKSWHSQRSKSK